MKITKKLYKRMERCCDWQNKVKEEEVQIEIELEKLGIDVGKMRQDDCCIVEFINYGNHTSKEQVERELNYYVSTAKNENRR